MAAVSKMSEAGPASIGPAPEKFHHGRDLAQLGMLKVVMGMPISVAQFDSVRPRAPMEKSPQVDLQQ